VSDIINDKYFLSRLMEPINLSAPDNVFKSHKAALTTIQQGTDTWEIIGRFEYLVTTEGAKEKCFRISDELENQARENLQSFLDLCLIFQDIHPEMRRTETHVEYVIDSWTSVFALLQEGLLFSLSRSSFAIPESLL
jgi:hypothetical protein